MTLQTIEFAGNYGSFTVCAVSGVVLAHEPDREAIADEGPDCFGYLDVVRVDLGERREWYSARGVDLPEIQPGGDVLDVGLWTALDGYVPAEFDWRGEIMLIRYCRPQS